MQVRLLSSLFFKRQWLAPIDALLSGARSSSLARKLIRRFLIEIGPLTASPNLGVSTGYAHDALYYVTAVVDEVGAAVVERYTYSPYGEPTILDANFSEDDNNQSDIDNEYLFTGRRRDPRTGLQINRWRYYHVPIGRWVNRDPIEYAAEDSNLYMYCKSNPALFSDPSGESPIAWLWWFFNCGDKAIAASNCKK